MKKIIAIIIINLCFIIPSQADDIKDFQLEGMSIGDTVLDHIQKKKVKKIKSPNKKIKIVRAYKRDNLEIFDSSQIWWFDEDKEQKIVGLAGELKFDNDISGCRKKQKEIAEDVKILFKDLVPRESENKNMHDKTGESKVYHLSYKFPNGDLINIQCYKFSKNLKEKTNVIDNLKLMILTKIMNDHYRTAR